MSVPKRARRRDHLYIMAQILAQTKTPTRKTHIMYKLALSYTQLMDYLKNMTSLGLLEAIRDEKGEPAAFRTTKKGLRYLQSYHEIRGLLQKEELIEETAFQEVREK